MSTVSEQISRNEACHTLLNDVPEPDFFSAHGAWRRWMVAAVVTVLAFVPFAFLKHEEQSAKGGASGAGNSFVSLPPPSETMSDELSDLYAWLSMASPMSGPRPDFEQGFSRYAYPQYRVSPIEIPDFQLQSMKLPGMKPVSQVVRPALLPSSEGLVFKTWDYFGFPVTYTVENRYPVSGWYWYIDGERALTAADTPDMPSAARAILEAAEKPFAPSEFDIIFSSEIPLPRILLRKGCGNPELDRMALTVLRKWLLPVWKNNGTFLDMPVRRIAIEWRLP